MSSIDELFREVLEKHGIVPTEALVSDLVDANEGVEDWDDESDSEWGDDEPHFADPGGRSALRAATRDNPRNLPCPTCGAPGRLTPADRALGYQCDSCADRAERGWGE